MQVEKVLQTFAFTITMDEDEGRSLQAQIAMARGLLRDVKKEKPEDHQELSKFLDVLTHQVPAKWKPRGT